MASKKDLLILGGAVGGLLLAAKLAQAAPPEAQIAGFGITEGSPAYLGISVPPGANILGRTTYKNNLLTPGSSIHLGFLLGEIREGTFYMYYFTYEGVDYYIGSLVGTSACAQGSSATLDIQSVAAFAKPEGDFWDAFAWVGVLTGTVRTLTSGGRIIGIRAEDFDYISPYHYATYEDVLKVISAAEVTAFSVVAG